ncbi:hypothetical protein B7P43_G02196 [Cryptotermes secundus]|uniref:Vesicle-associated membrane protein 7 n=1 Tax=Cryptotermes secundus TaxID=105785 RepID=A0A2J7PNK9_9NEOP|nr:vesicle-associated membrane protein 725 [Cryptotermes secundus]PNF17917.1 hypothetical protein B7P43_G02196 [Cryptotermes secundus]
MEPKTVVQIRYCCISYGEVILVSHQTEAENYTPMIHSVLRTLNSTEDKKLAFPVDSFQVHVLIENGIAFTCVTYLTRKHYLPFSFLDALKEKFLEVPSLCSRAVTASENEFDRDFCPVMASVVYDFNIGRGDKVSKLRAQVEDVKQIMLDNVDKVIGRGERLDDLLSKTEDLESHGTVFRQGARDIRVKMRCKNLRMWLVIGGLLTLVLTVTILSACGVIHW